MKKIIFILIAFLSNSYIVLAWDDPFKIPEGLPWEGWGDDVVEKVSSNIIAEMIKYVVVLAVIALMISWIMYMFSNGEEEKTKKAKSWIIWSLTAVVLSISSYYIVTTIAWIQINLK